MSAEDYIPLDSTLGDDVDDDPPELPCVPENADAAAQERYEAFWDNERNCWHFRASSYGNCYHGLVLGLRGGHSHRPSAFMRSRFAAGSASEERIVALIHSVGAELNDAECHHSLQRKVRMSGVIEGETYTISCSLDGWGPNAWDFIADTVGGDSVYDPHLSLVENEELYQEKPFVFEHKSVTPDKWKSIFEEMLAAPGLIDPEKMKTVMKTYSWQISAQMWAFREDQNLEEPPQAFFSLELVEAVLVNGEAMTYTPTQRAVLLLDRPPYTHMECLEHCAEAVRLYRSGIVPRCDSEWPCNWGFGQVSAVDSGPPLLETYADVNHFDQICYQIGLKEMGAIFVKIALDNRKVVQ